MIRKLEGEKQTRAIKGLVRNFTLDDESDTGELDRVSPKREPNPRALVTRFLCPKKEFKGTTNSKMKSAGFIKLKLHT